MGIKLIRCHFLESLLEVADESEALGVIVLDQIVTLSLAHIAAVVSSTWLSQLPTLPYEVGDVSSTDALFAIPVKSRERCIGLEIRQRGQDLSLSLDCDLGISHAQ